MTGARAEHRAPWSGAASPSWSSAVDVPPWLALREGRRPIVFVAPHGGRRGRDARRGDSVNDLHTAAIAWELAERLDAHALVNHGLDRNEIDLNRIGHLVSRAPGVLRLLAAAVDAAGGEGDVPLVLFVHGWNMVVPCCDVGVGLRRRAGRLTGRHPTLSRERYDTTVAAIERELAARGLSAAIGRRYTASGRENAAQLFSGRFADHEHDVVADLARLALAGAVDAAQLELGIPLRWPGPLREAFLDGLVAALDEIPPGRADGVHEGRARAGWSLPPAEPRSAHEPVEPGWSLQAVLDDGGRVAMFAGVEATGPRSMAARFSIVSTDGTMMLLVGEGDWSGDPGCYALEGLRWCVDEAGSRIEVSVGAAAAPGVEAVGVQATAVQAPGATAVGTTTAGTQMLRYRTHDAYLDLERGLAASRLVPANLHLVFDATAPDHGCLRGHVRAGDVALDVDTIAFVDRGGRRSADPRERLRVVGRRADRSVFAERSHAREAPTLRLHEHAGELGTIRTTQQSTEPGALVEAKIAARVPVWRPLGDGLLVRWTFGIVQCRHAGSDETSAGLFEALELFASRAPGDSSSSDDG